MHEILENTLFSLDDEIISELATLTGTVCRKDGVLGAVLDGEGCFAVVDGILPVGCKEGDKVALIPREGGVRIAESFGSSGEVEPNVRALLRREGLDKPFDAEALMQGKQTAFTEIQGLMGTRTDLRVKTIITLSETENSRNECGFSVETDKDGNYVLGIHTTDVAAFVGKGSPLESAARERCKTADLPTRDIPMLPDSITKGPCFLEVGKDALAVSYFLTIDDEGRVKNFDVCESIVKTAANCLFSEFDALFLEYEPSAIMPLRKAYASILPTVANMFSLGAILQAARMQRGGGDIDKAQRHFVYSRHGGRPVGVLFRKDSDPKRLIREFFSVAGAQLAEYLQRKGVAAIYRVQPEPSDSALARFRADCGAAGIDTSDFGNDELLTAVAESIRGTRHEELVLTSLRSVLPATSFSTTPSKHFLYKTDMYIRFAFPLNRYADYCIQYIVKAILKAEAEGEALTAEELIELKEFAEAGAAAAMGENRINNAEKFVEELTALDCLRRDRNKSYSGAVLSIEAGKARVLLDNGCVGIITEGNGVVIDAENGVMKADGAEYRYGSEINLRFASADLVNATLYLEF